MDRGCGRRNEQRKSGIFAAAALAAVIVVAVAVVGSSGVLVRSFISAAASSLYDNSHEDLFIIRVRSVQFSRTLLVDSICC